jgi:RNA polymerase sigma-70 factor (ECF subfamily)
MQGEAAVEDPHPRVVAEARRGDAAAFEELVRIYQADIWRLCFHLLGSRTLADDVTQDAFVRAYRFLPRFRGDAKFSTWLFSIARNCALDELRRAGRRKRIDASLQAEPDRYAPEATLGIEVREAVAGLALDLREPLVMIDVMGQSYAEVAEAMRLPLGTVKSRVHRARQLLAHALGDHVEETTNEA